MPLELQQADALAAHGEKAVAAGAGGAVLFGFNANEIGIIVGAIVGVCGLMITWYYKHKSYLLRKQLIERQIQELNDEEDED